MIPPFNFRGYTAPDPLDRAPTAMAFVITMAVSGVVALIFLYIGSMAYPAYRFEHTWIYWVGVAIYTFAMGPLLVALRKSSSILFYLMIVAVGVPIDLFQEAHLRPFGTGWWTYQPGSFLTPIPVPLKFLAAWTGDGIIQGPLALWFARLVAGVVYP